MVDLCRVSRQINRPERRLEKDSERERKEKNHRIVVPYFPGHDYRALC